MNKLKYIFGFVMVLTVESCTDFVDPAIPYSGFETGAFLRTISATGSFKFNILETLNFDLEVEAVDEQNGGLVEKVDVFVARRRGNTVSSEVLLTTIAKSQFASNSESKYLRASASMSMSSIFTAMSFTKADFAGGDFLEFRLVLTDSKARTFTNNNLSSDAAGGAFYSSPFFYRVPLVCAEEIENPAGDWVIDMVDNYGDGWQGGYIRVVIDGDDGATAPRAWIPSQYLPPPEGSGGVPLSEGQAIFSIPASVTSLSFEWSPDSYNSECEFTITSPKGNVVASVVGPTFEGTIKLDLCKE